MPTLKLYYDGWLALPAGLRQKLGLDTGDRLEVELIDGALMLRRSDGVKRAVLPKRETAGVPAAGPNLASVTRKPGRPEKSELAAPVMPAPGPKRPRGRPRKTADPAPPPDP